jgi:polyisoprenyl-phosphate glycosyltransferase
MKHIAIVTPVFNERENIEELLLAVESIFSNIENYKYTHLFIDNSSTDGSEELLMQLTDKFDNVKAIINARNFGYVRSSFYGLINLDADATILLACDFQEPPELIHQFIEQWEKGHLVVGGIKVESEESKIKRFLRTVYYKLVNSLSDVELIDHYFDFGLYDRSVIKELRQISDTKPYLRGLIPELGYKVSKIEFKQLKRKRGKTKQNWYELFDTVMLGLTSQSKVPLRLATIVGFVVATLSFLSGIYYFIRKVVSWDSFEIGVAPLVIGMFFMSSALLITVGIVGEYVGSIHTQTLKRKYILEKNRYGFNDENVKKTS